MWWRLAIIGVGFALTMSPLTGAAIQAVSRQESGLASGISSTTRQIGAVLGVAVLGAIGRTRESGGASFEAGLDSAFAAAGAVTSISATFTSIRLVKSNPAEVPAPRAQPANSSRSTHHPDTLVTFDRDGGGPSPRW